jgi:hypothetical protein
MGTRIHKQIGYGLKIKTRKSGIPHDPRWDYEKFSMCTTNHNHFLDWCIAHKSDIIAQMLQEGSCSETEYHIMIEDIRKNKHLSNSGVFWDSDIFKNLLLFTPTDKLHLWRRQDDIIDYVENTQQDRITRLNKGIWPYSNFMRRWRHPVELKQKLLDATPIIQACSNTDTKLPEEFLAAGQHDRLLTVLEDEELQNHFENDWRPTIPPGVLALIMYLDCFPDAFGENGIVNALRPLAITYWG